MKLAFVAVVAVFAVWAGYMACTSLVKTATDLQQQSTTSYQIAMED
ncbi:MAG: hypothetical protein WC455_22500 [Dehalococcoidia bacterium]